MFFTFDTLDIERQLLKAEEVLTYQILNKTIDFTDWVDIFNTATSDTQSEPVDYVYQFSDTLDEEVINPINSAVVGISTDAKRLLVIFYLRSGKNIGLRLADIKSLKHVRLIKRLCWYT